MDNSFSGIVIKVSHYKDFDAMVTVLTTDGIKSFMAKGVFKIKSKNSRALALYSYSTFELLDSKYGNVLKTATCISSVFNSYNSFDALNCLSIMGETTFNSINEYDNFDMMTILNKCIQNLEDGIDPYTVTLQYLILLMKKTGEGISFEGLNCDNKLKNELMSVYDSEVLNDNISDNKALILDILLNIIEQLENTKGFTLKSKNLL